MAMIIQFPRSTVEALMYSLREHGSTALTEPATQRRVGELSEEQLHEIGGRLQHIAMWTADEIEQLVVAWLACHA
jgi:transposase